MVKHPTFLIKHVERVERCQRGGLVPGFCLVTSMCAQIGHLAMCCSEPPFGAFADVRSWGMCGRQDA